MNFKQWLENSLSDLLKPVPQSPIHHGEGNVWIHTRMVRKQLNDAISYFQKLTQDKNSPFSNLDPTITSDELNLLRIAAWQHDIGKASATTIDDDGKIKAHGHEDAEHFEPMMQRLGEPWQTMYKNASLQDKEDLWFMIKNHMSLRQGFGKKILNQLLDQQGKYKNIRKVKLLLILIMMDQSGRISADGPNGSEAFPDIANKMTNSAKSFKIIPSKEVTNDPVEFLQQLKTRGLPPSVIKQAFKGKFGYEPEEI